MPGQRTPTLVFDLDGTLLDVSARHHHVYSALCVSLDGRPLDRATYWELKRQRTGWPDILAQSGIQPDLYNAFESEFQAQIELPANLGFDVLFPASLGVLTKLAATHRMVLVSLRNSATALRAQLSVFALQPFFEAIESAGDGGEPPFRVKARLIRKTVPEDEPGVVIGDTEADVMAASSLGYPSIAVCSGIRDRDILAQQEPTYLVDDVSGVEDALRKGKLL